MGKYMRKAKATGDVAVMEVSQSSLGVRTRARTLALQRRLRGSPPPPDSGASYLQLRSRRLHLKPPCSRNHPRPSAAPELADSPPENDVGGTAEEASFGDNVLEFEGRERGTRESTPCSLVRDPDAVRTPGSTTRPTSAAETNWRTLSSSQRHIPTANEMDEFFAGAEFEQQKHFIDKYNFDPVNDKPLLGRYEWEKVDL